MSLSLSALKEAALSEIQAASSLEALEGVRLSYLGRKGKLTEILKGLGSLPADERKSTAKQANVAKQAIGAALDEQFSQLEELALKAKLAQERIDISLPGKPFDQGGLHPVTRVLDRIQKLLGQVGFQVESGPEIEDEFHNFTALNIAEHHPARAMHDTFYIEPGVLLRTHTSPVQVRAVERRSAPLKIIAPGRVYRCDFDQTHTPMFHQVEGLVINKTANFSELKHLMTTFLKAFFEDAQLQIRFRPSYFPFTEPSAEVDIKASQLGGGDWLEVLGCGMVHPNVLNNMGLSPDEWQGYAFGLGVERLAMLRYGVRDLRLFFDNDLSFLKQFQG